MTLAAIAFPFVLTMLGVGLWISTRASTRGTAMQMTIGTFLPSIFLFGLRLPDRFDAAFFQVASQFVPATWLIDAARGVILRGGGWSELWAHALVLWAIAMAMLFLSTLKFRKQVG